MNDEPFAIFQRIEIIFYLENFLTHFDVFQGIELKDKNESKSEC